MSNVTYDMDTSGGLMPLIRALIKPPDEEPSVPKPKKSQHPYYKRPGKGHNHDSCDACGEGGDLICCDRCPASFHLGCYDPPLDENDIPAGLWLCRECKARDAEKPSSARGSRAPSPTDSKSDTEKKTRNLRSRDSSKKGSNSSDGEEKEKKEAVPEKELSPMEILVDAARIMNPTQFELPREMRIPCIFPGTEKEGTKNGNASVVTVDHMGCVPLPAKSCFVCQGTCKHAPLIQCDYCPLLFHQDCLDPPLTALPTGRWMCPNHVENYIDWKLVNSISATERVALWDRFSAPVDQHAVKIDFIRQARKYRPRFRQKIPVSVLGRVRVPAAVKAQYAHPPPLRPARREHVRCNNVLKHLKQNGLYSESSDEDGPKHEICLNIDCTTEHNAPPPKQRKLTATHSDDDDDKKVSKEHSDSDSSSLSSSDGSRLPAAPRRARRPRAPPRPALRAAPAADAVLADVERQLRHVDDKLLKLLAWQRLEQILAGELCYGSLRGAPLSERAARAVLKSVPPAAGLPPPRPSELLSKADRERIACVVWGGRPEERPASPTSPVQSISDACVRATLCPTSSGVGRAVGMRGSVLRVGSGAGCHVRLCARRCSRVSPHHADIFMDEVSRHFELINYSEYGTVVNGVVYACDVTRAHSPAGAAGGQGGAGEAGEREAALRGVVAARMPRPYRINGNLTAAIPAEHPCRCGAMRGAAARGAWEGSALVPHGALLEFGCQAYVFSITDALPAEPADEPDD